MPKPKFHILVCTTTRPPGNPRGSCGEKGSRDLLPAFFEEMEKRMLFGQVLVTESSFHGRTLATLSATGNRKVQAGFEPLVVVSPSGQYQPFLAAAMKVVLPPAVLHPRVVPVADHRLR